MSGGVIIKEASFATHRESIQAVRYSVFVKEQGVPVELEMDEKDPHCTHVLAWHDGEAIATGRLLLDGHIGRVAVAREWRGRGVGGRLMRKLLHLARSHEITRVTIASQVRAIGFYERLGFRKVGETYLEAGIEHVDMMLDLPLP